MVLWDACVVKNHEYENKEWTKGQDTSFKSALRGGVHAANYRGCEFYHNLLKRLIDQQLQYHHIKFKHLSYQEMSSNKAREYNSHADVQH